MFIRSRCVTARPAQSDQKTALHRRHWRVENYGRLFGDKRSRGNMGQLVVSKEGFYMFKDMSIGGNDYTARP